MSNSWFQFKQFRIHQDRCAMKVTTDACVFGAWLANQIAASGAYQQALDIGTGTGLLSLMLAQQQPKLHIEAVEVEEAAAKQAFQNVSSSKFAAQIEVYHTDFLCYDAHKKYDLIFSNPPFHQQQLKGNNNAKNKAHHDEGLTLDELVPKATALLTSQGTLALLLPYYRKQEMLVLAAAHQLFAHEICLVKQSAHHDFFRVLFLLSKIKITTTQESRIQIFDEAPNYSSGFVKLLQPYYLNL